MIRANPSRQTQSICWQCQWRLTNQRRAFSQRAHRRDGLAPRVASRLPRRGFHATRSASQIALQSSVEPSVDPALLQQNRHKLPTRQHLQQWNEEFGGPDALTLSAFERHPAHGDILNSLEAFTYGNKADEDVETDEQIRYEEEAEEEELITVGLFLSPGDVVELSSPGREPVLAVFVQQLDLTSQFYSVNGRWSHARQENISFAMPGAIHSALLEPLLPYLPTRGADLVVPKASIQVPQELGAPIQKLLSQLTEESELIYRTNAPVLDTAYSTLADATRTRMMTLPQIAKSLLGKGDPKWSPSPAALLAVRKALKHNDFQFRSDAYSQRLTNIFAIRPQADVAMVETVHDWVREYREHEAALVSSKDGQRHTRSTGARHVHDFVTKARRLVAESRKSRPSNLGFMGPDGTRGSSTQDLPGVGTTVPGEGFTETDQQIISFLQAWVLMDQFKNMSNLHSACTSIIHAVGCYNHVEPPKQRFFRLGKAAGQLLLQEIGVISPFENRSIYNESLMLPTVRLTRNIELLATKTEALRQNPDLHDSMADVRHDWGSLPVYCIDSADAKEIDDGISIERVYGKPSEYWIHVHIANPTAFFNKGHVLSGLAAHGVSTVYTPERAFAMLPSWVAQNHFSIAKNRPVITFSARIDDCGNTLDTKIQHGIVKNVIKLTPDEVTILLGERPVGETKRIVVGGELPTRKSSRRVPQLATEELQALRDLYTAAQHLWKGRKTAGAVRFGQSNSAKVAVFENPNMGGLTWMQPSTEKVRRVVGDPIIEIRGQVSHQSSYFSEDIHSGNIVEEMMILACRTAGVWCSERNIHAVYRGTVESPTSSLSLQQFRERVLYPQLEKTGSMSYAVAQSYLNALGRTIAHTSPIAHSVIGTEAYVRVTSPLRRFSDMIAHWQIEAALRYEAQSGQKFDAQAVVSSPRPVLPFSLHQIQESIKTLSPRETVIKRAEQQSDEFWKLQVFTRAFYYHEAPLPDTFTARVQRPDPSGLTTTGYLEDGYGTRVIIAESPEGGYEFGDRWEVKISDIDPSRGLMYTLPIRLIERE